MSALVRILRLFWLAGLTLFLFRGFMLAQKVSAATEGLGSQNGERPKDKEINKGNPATKLQKAIALKDYAIQNNLFVPDNILTTLNNVEHSVEDRDKAKNALNLDIAIRDLTEITYPTTLDTIQDTDDSQGSLKGSHLQWFLPLLVIVTLVIAIYSYAFVEALDPSSNNTNAGNTNAGNTSIQTTQFLLDFGVSLAKSVVAASLGLMGTLVYMLFNLIGILSEKAFNIRDTYVNWLRLALGPALAWVLYFGLKSTTAQGTETWAVLLLPFLAGFSIRLVVGVLTQALRAIELVLGIENRDTQLLRRRRGRTGGG
jgi:flagellar basal body-associated protein FliL